MAGIKRLKKNIKALVSHLVEECETFRGFHPEVDSNKVSAVITELEGRLKKVIYKLNHYKYQKDHSPRAYFNDIYREVTEEIIPTMDRLGKL